uniref:Putative secreted protein n=1 Tax=Ixodes ricinus TaxID=34613 RepID=A0A6B0V0N1_IXORI
MLTQVLLLRRWRRRRAAVIAVPHAGRHGRYATREVHVVLAHAEQVVPVRTHLLIRVIPRAASVDLEQLVPEGRHHGRLALEAVLDVGAKQRHTDLVVQPVLLAALQVIQEPGVGGAVLTHVYLEGLGHPLHRLHRVVDVAILKHVPERLPSRADVLELLLDRFAVRKSAPKFALPELLEPGVRNRVMFA